jgi:hypothetical protein
VGAVGRRCDPHYDGSGNPTSDGAKDLDGLGIRMIACQPFVTQIYDVVQMYQDWTPFLMIMLWVGLFFYFITSSDSGSFVDDLLGSSGLSKPPAIQKVYWGFTEGAVASILVGTAPGGSFQSVLKGLRAVSICAGMPLTVFMCLMVPSTYRALKFEFNEQDIIKSKKFNTQVFDFFECFDPVTKTPYSGQAGKQMTTIAIALVAPGIAVYKTLAACPDQACSKVIVALLAQITWLLWLILHFVQIGTGDSGSMAWTFFCFFTGTVGYTRATCRKKYNVWGSIVEDMWLALTMYPFVLSQSQLMVENDGEGAPDYFADLTRALELDGKAPTKEAPAKTVTAVA